jgi:hypothetical protein
MNISSKRFLWYDRVSTIFSHLWLKSLLPSVKEINRLCLIQLYCNKYILTIIQRTHISKTFFRILLSTFLFGVIFLDERHLHWYMVHFQVRLKNRHLSNSFVIRHHFSLSYFAKISVLSIKKVNTNFRKEIPFKQYLFIYLCVY